MSHSFSDRVIALAALGQALQQVRRIADTGQADAAVVGTALDSVFRIDAPTPAAVFGRTSEVTAGLRLLRSYLMRENHDENLLRLGMSVLQLERRFVRANETVEAVSEGIHQIGEKSGQQAHAHPDVIAALGGLYADTISHLRPRVMVQGNPHYLAQPGVVAEIRAVLLAAVRAAVLWRQVGGSYWDFLFSRRAMIEATNELLG